MMSRYLLNWRLIGFIVIVGSCFILAAVLITNQVKINHDIREACEPYADVAVKDIPAKCVSFWNEQ